MSDTTGFLAGCATTGMAVLLLLVARVGLDESPPAVQSRSDGPGSELTPPIPVPSPPNAPQEQSMSFAQPFRRDLDRHRDVLERLESQLDDQQLLIRNLENKLDRQETETAAVVAQLKEYQYSMDTLATQQQIRSAEAIQPDVGERQSALIWVGAGVLLILIFGGGVVLVILIVMTAQNRRRASRNTQITHPINVTPSYRYYQHEFLPPPINTKPAGQYEPYDYGG